ncbi:hypothetical protein [Sporolactobacillus laevolacticus]|uniref:Uncharacterized protein n=1 Tax=Sporolactobacillus laevolacticus DSM 442 TaxID=1395513 RepID=V6IVU5_9BACL|nr:hypothetical protein [Sporolactobacillus laevolacticus]EST11265.1 hypothetical protein P343_12680 [Sporolactobacillus laevolacticus DSM 442]
MKNFLDYKAEKEGIITPKSVIENLIKAINEGLVENVVFCVKTEDGEIKYGYSEQDQLQALGLFEAGKTLLLSDMDCY